MCSVVECRVCYCVYNSGRRCPRMLHCEHSFCESCLLTLSRTLWGRVQITCPLCRRHTTVSTEETHTALSYKEVVSTKLKVDQRAMQRLLLAGVLDQVEEEEEEEEEERPQQRDVANAQQVAAQPERANEERSAEARSRSARFRRFWKNFLDTMIEGNAALYDAANGDHACKYLMIWPPYMC